MKLEMIKLEQVQLLIFTGVSGSGKSTSLHNLLRDNPALQGKKWTAIKGSPIQWQSNLPMNQLVLVDELVNIQDVYHVMHLLRHGRQVIAASHLPGIYHRLLAFMWKARIIRVDQDPMKIHRYLSNRGITCSESTLADFFGRFRASYIDADLVLEQYPGMDFDQAWSRFKRTHRIQHTPESMKTTSCGINSS